MDTIPLEIIFNVFIAGLFIVYWGLTFIILYHLVRFGIGVQPKRLAGIFILGSLVLSAIALIFFLQADITQFVNI